MKQIPSAEVGGNGAIGHRVQQHVPVEQEIDIVSVIRLHLDTERYFVR